MKSTWSTEPVKTKQVAPYTGAWIEIRTHWKALTFNKVAPYTGAWIEISRKRVLTARS